eukprot:Rhum_TRINITY_DN13082_c1_g2::Rhum_TRINITY_DN13082_c1_g2_i1::g.56073::m.56073
MASSGGCVGAKDTGMAEVCAASSPSAPRKRRLRDGSAAAKRLRVVFADGVVAPPSHSDAGGSNRQGPQRCLWMCDEKDTVTFAKVFRRMVHDLLPWERSKGAAGRFDAYLEGYKVRPQQTAGVLRDNDLIEVRRRGTGADAGGGGAASPAEPPSPSPSSSSSSGDPIPLERRRRLMLSDDEADVPTPAAAAAAAAAVAPPPPLPAAAEVAASAVGGASSPSLATGGGAAAKLPPSQYGQAGAAAPCSPHPLLAGVLSPVSAVAAAVPAGGVDHMSGSNSPLLVTLLMQQVSTLSHVVMSLRDEIRAASASPVPLATPRSAAAWPHGVASPPSLPPCPRCSHSPQG